MNTTSLKTRILASTALVAAAALAGAGTAEAAEKIKLDVGGFYNATIGWVDGPDKYNSSVDGRDSMPFDVKTNAEIWFSGSTKLDNGITVGLQVNLEANTSGDQIDESYVYLDSAYGKLILGDKNNAAYLLAVGAPNVGVPFGIDPGELANWMTAANGTASDIASSPLVGGALLSDDDSTKITYLTPRLWGFQAGVSYIPTFNQDTQTQREGAVSRGWVGALNYENTFGGLGTKAFVGYAATSNTTAAVQALDDASIRAWLGGASLSYAGFTLGGSYVRSYSGNVAGSTTDSQKGSGWQLGLAYEWDKYGVSFTYHSGASEGLIADPDRDNGNVYILGGNYNLGPGVDLKASAFYAQFDSEGGRSGANPWTNEDEGITEYDGTAYGIVTGVFLSF